MALDKLEVRVEKGEDLPRYTMNVDHATLFMRSGEDKIVVSDRNEEVEITVYSNAELVFIGTQGEFYQKLRK